MFLLKFRNLTRRFKDIIKTNLCSATTIFFGHFMAHSNINKLKNKSSSTIIFYTAYKISCAARSFVRVCVCVCLRAPVRYRAAYVERYLGSCSGKSWSLKLI